MTTTNILRQIMKEQNVGTSKIARILDKEPRFISDRIRSTNICIKNLGDILKVLDYKLVIVPSSHPIPKDSFEVTFETDTSNQKKN